VRIALVFPFYDRPRDPDDALATFPLLRELPRELAARGHIVTVCSLAAADARLDRNGVRYAFVRPDRLVLHLGRLLQRWKPRYGAAYYQVSPRLARTLRASRPDVVHVFGLTLDLQLALLARTTQRLGVPLVAHYHGGLPETGRYRRLQRHNLARVTRALFTTQAQVNAWIAAGLLSPAQTALLPETSSAFVGLPREVARAQTAMAGDPVCLSAGRLAPIKDPLTTLRGFAKAAEQLPNARLYFYYLTDELLLELRAYIEGTPGLAERVEFRGRAPAEAMEAIYSSADLLLQASQREWSGLAVLEALSCGCLPVVTDIPSFVELTDGGRYGRLFPPGDHSALAVALLSLDADARAALAPAAQTYFQRELSFTALARRLDELYAALAVAEYNQDDDKRRP
jgi:glycosyltransferase involved in cell wall biosynthesis